MCGIAGMVDLTARRPIDVNVLHKLARALVHRGPEEEGIFTRPGLGLASRRLRIIDLADGRQPITNEDGSVVVVYNGELFDFREQRADLQARGHHFRTHCDTEIIPHLWEEYGEQMFDRLRGQFAFALWDERQRKLILARDRFGICPLFWTRQSNHDGSWLLFASEIKALLASGMVPAVADPRGLNQVFHFFASPGPMTCFQDIQMVRPGHYLSILPGRENGSPAVRENRYWAIDFPDAGDEDPGVDPRKVIDGFEEVLYRSVERRLRADVPVVSYLSGGVDSSLVVAMASRVLGRPIPTFTVRVLDKKLDETASANIVARHVGSESVIVPFGPTEMMNTYQRLVRTAETPVLDTSCAAVLLLAEQVHQRGYKVVLTGEGADEWLAGYSWYKVNRLFGMADVIPGLPMSNMARRLFLRCLGAPPETWELAQKAHAAVGGPNAWTDLYSLMALPRLRLFRPELREALIDHNPYADLTLDQDRLRRWHPLNRGLCVGAQVLLAGMLLCSKGDRVAMHSSVEARYPFLDEEVFAYLARLHPSWKLRGWTEKYLLRKVAERWLPRSIAWRRKEAFRAPLDPFLQDSAPPFISRLLSEESLRQSGYFDPAAVHYWRNTTRQLRQGSFTHLAMSAGLAGVVATQMWHQQFIDSSLGQEPAKKLYAMV